MLGRVALPPFLYDQITFGTIDYVAEVVKDIGIRNVLGRVVVFKQTKGRSDGLSGFAVWQ